MKKYFLLLTCAALLAACDKTDSVKEITVSVQITAPAGAAVPDAYQVEFINYNDNSKVEKTAAAARRWRSVTSPPVS